MKADGGAAFPRAPFEVNDYCGDGSPGMTLRDWFAGQALAGIIGKYPCEICDIKPGEYASVNVSAAKGAYAYADAMLAERERGE